MFQFLELWSHPIEYHIVQCWQNDLWSNDISRFKISKSCIIHLFHSPCMQLEFASLFFSLKRLSYRLVQIYDWRESTQGLDFFFGTIMSHHEQRNCLGLWLQRLVHWKMNSHFIWWADCESSWWPKGRSVAVHAPVTVSCPPWPKRLSLMNIL